MNSKIFTLIITLLLTGMLVFPDRDSLRVEEVVDGDTLKLSNGETVRLIGIDTPELHLSYKMRQQVQRTPHDRETIRKLGKAARDYMKRLVKGRALELTYDPANASSNHRGGFDRLLAYVWVLDESGERTYMVNRRMVADGYAYAYTKYPFQYMEEFRRLARQARSQNRGLWQTMQPRNE